MTASSMLMCLFINAVVNVMEYRPSVIAAAAVLAESNRRLTRTSIELKIGTMSSCSSLEIVSPFSSTGLISKDNEKFNENVLYLFLIFVRSMCFPVII